MRKALSKIGKRWSYTLVGRSVTCGSAKTSSFEVLFSEAIPHYEKAVELADTPYELGFLGHAYAKSGRVDEAHAILQRLEEQAKSRYVAPLARAYVYAGLGDLDRSFEWLEKAYDERSSNLLFARVFPIGKDIEHDPRFFDLMRRIGL